MRIAKAVARTGGFLLVNPTDNLPTLSPELKEQVMMVGKSSLSIDEKPHSYFIIF